MAFAAQFRSEVRMSREGTIQVSLDLSHRLCISRIFGQLLICVLEFLVFLHDVVSELVLLRGSQVVPILSIFTEHWEPWVNWAIALSTLLLW